MERWLDIRSIALTGCLASFVSAEAAVPTDRVIRIQPIQVCSDDGAFCANANRVLFEAETTKIWAQAGIHVEFLPWRQFSNSLWLDLSTSLFSEYNIFGLAGTPGHGQNLDPKVINAWFVRRFDNGAFGHSLQSTPEQPGLNGVGVADNAFAANGGKGRVDVIAHELGHNLGLDHTTLGAGAPSNLMTQGRSVPESLSDIYPDGSGLDFLNDAQIRQARSAPFGVPPVLPIIREPPVDMVANHGGTATFSAKFDGTTPLRFQWLFNRTNVLSGATNSALVLSDLDAAQGGAYQVSVSNLWGSATSGVAMLVIADADTDGDGMSDGWEWAHGFDLHSGTDAELDADGDGLSNLQEFLAGTEPRDRQSSLKVEKIEAPVGSHGIASIVFQGRTGRNYAVEWRRHLDRGPWQTFTNVPTLPANQPVTVWDPSGAGQPERWYRIVIPPAP